MEDEKQKLQNEIKRDSPENKLKDFLLWTESKLKNYTHTVSTFSTYCLYVLYMYLSVVPIY